MAEVIASTFLKPIFQKLTDEAMKQVGQVQGIPSKLKSLEKTLYRIQALLADASDKEIKQDLVQNWLNDLKHLAYDIDDILDDLETDGMHPEFAKNSGASTSKRKPQKNFFGTELSSFLTRTLSSKVSPSPLNLDIILLNFPPKPFTFSFGFILSVSSSLLKETLVRPFSVCARGSKVIITTRKDQLLKESGCGQLNQLQCLSDDDDVSLFCQHALDANNFDLYPTLKAHGEDIVGKCKGLPLALMALGRLLRKKRGCRRMEGNGGYLCKMDDFVLLWMAEGFLHQSDPSKSTEERLGHYYFEELLSWSFFQHAPHDESLFVMHDLMHDLATSVACWGVLFQVRERDGKEAKCLRTFLSVGVKDRWQTNYLPKKILVDLLPQLPLLRVINLSDYMISEVPECIGSLKHLRYINLSRTNIRSFPETVCDLYNLQTLIVFGCSSLAKFPNNFSKLKNLRHLDIRDTPQLKDMPLGVGELKSLQTLSKIIIGRENDFSITQLKDLKNLSGSVSIKGLNKMMLVFGS
nr:hypothetical protein [Tanacetum cinerariifolium]